jgi:uncharacterized protein YqeY
MPSEIYIKIQEDLKNALKSGDSFVSGALRYIISEIKNKEIELRVTKEELSDEKVLGVLSKQAKQRDDSISEFKKGNRADLVDKEEKELSLIKSYLPAGLTEVEIKALVDAAILETGASAPADMGKVMKVLMPKVAGKADGKMVSEMVKNALS